MRKELWFGFVIMALIIIPTAIFMPWSNMSSGHLGLLMLSLVVVAIMLGFPTAFTLMGMGMIFAFFSYHQQIGNSGQAIARTLDLMVQRTYSVMTNDVLISIPLFVFMGYLVERANLIEKLFKSLHLALARVPGSLAVATLVTCAIFATATGIVGAVVTLMGLLALPAMLRAGYSVQLSAGAITAGGCLGILIPPSVMLIVYGATAGVSVVQLYAGAFFPGIMLALLYMIYVIIIAKVKPSMAPPLPESERHVPMPAHVQSMGVQGAQNALAQLLRALKGRNNAAVPTRTLLRELMVLLAPAIVFAVIMGLTWNSLTKPDAVQDTSTLQQMGGESLDQPAPAEPAGLAEPPKEDTGLSEPLKTDSGLSEPPKSADGVAEPPGAEKVAEPPADKADAKPVTKAAKAEQARHPAPNAFWIVVGVGVVTLLVFYSIFTFTRLEIFKMLLGSFFPLAVLILAVLGTIVFGLATPTEAAAIGSLGGFVLAAVYMAIARPKEESRRVLKTWAPFWIVGLIAVVWFILLKAEVLTEGPPVWVGWLSMAAIGIWCLLATFQVKLGGTVRESVFLTGKTSAMVCWLFVGSSIFSAAFALLGGQELIEKWVLSLGLTPIQFLLLSQAIIFILGWPLEWTEIIVIFMPIFIPLLAKFNIDPLFFGLLVALNLQTAFLSPPVAMAAFYLKGVSPPHVTLNQIFMGMLPFMGIQILAIFLLYMFPQIGLWLPQVLYR
ncbi:MAG: TRAP transporter large permease subunit [Burkholderiales bacterium]|nr:TRAP transporter large permease subunit [Burkholderiales bacterium]